jgi:hypothetical protein
MRAGGARNVEKLSLEKKPEKVRRLQMRPVSASISGKNWHKDYDVSRKEWHVNEGGERQFNLETPYA